MTTRDFILEKTEELIYQQGYVATSISDIMQASGVGKGQLYHYFTSKKAIGLEVIQKLLTKWRQELLGEILSQANPDKALLDMVDWFYDFHRNQTVFHGCPLGNLIAELASQEGDFQVLLEEFVADWELALTGVLRERQPELDMAAAQEQAVAIMASLQGGVLLVKVRQNLASLELVRHRLLADLGLLFV